MADPILSFDGENQFLSNFYPCHIHSPDGMDWWFPTVEHAFQAAKTEDPEERVRIWAAPTPGKAKRLGKKVTLRPNWNDLRLGVMDDLVRQKFADRDLQRRLLASGDAELVEGNTWGDTYWGVCKSVGQNHLGRILMKIRSELRAL